MFGALVVLTLLKRFHWLTSPSLGANRANASGEPTPSEDHFWARPVMSKFFQPALLGQPVQPPWKDPLYQ